MQLEIIDNCTIHCSQRWPLTIHDDDDGGGGDDDDDDDVGDVDDDDGDDDDDDDDYYCCFLSSLLSLSTVSISLSSVLLRIIIFL